MSMSSSRLVSIVVPVYGVQDYIAQCIDSLLTQRYDNIEVILVDDGSKDRSAEVCDKYASLDRRIRVVHKANGGLVSARKAGVAVATGEYLGFVDGDDWVDVDFFDSLFDHAATNSADLVIAGHTREFFGKCEAMLPRNPVGTYKRDDVVEKLLPTAIYNGVFFQHGVSTYVWNKLFRRGTVTRLVNEVSEDIVMGEDAAITYPYLARSDRVVISPSTGYFYRQRSNSIVKSVPDISQEYHRLGSLFRFLRSKFSGLPFSAELLRQLRYYFYAQVLVRSGAVVRSGTDSHFLIPFPKLALGNRIVIYSSGSFGQHMVRAIRSLSGFELSGWIDEDDLESQQSGLPVSSVDAVSTLNFDLILIAAIDSEYAARVAGQLVEKGVDQDKISVMSVDFDQLDLLLQEIGFDTQSFAFCDQLASTHSKVATMKKF